MGNIKKYALLDTDFLFKTNLSQKDSGHVLADYVINLDDYEFICHEMILAELGRHKLRSNPLGWLKNKIANGKVLCFTDSAMIDILEKYYGKSASAVYFTMLQESCNAFELGFFEKYYAHLENLDYIQDKHVFLESLRECDAAIPSQNSMGEKKSYVLLQIFQQLYPNRVYIFCSDDGRARQNIISLNKEVKCLSVVALFQKLKELGYDKEEIQPYYDSLCSYYSAEGQNNFRVWAASDRPPKKVKIVFDQLLTDIYDGKMIRLRNGDLKYKTVM